VTTNVTSGTVSTVKATLIYWTATGTNSGAAYQLEYSVNGGSTWTVQSLPNPESSASCPSGATCTFATTGSPNPAGLKGVQVTVPLNATKFASWNGSLQVRFLGNPGTGAKVSTGFDLVHVDVN